MTVLVVDAANVVGSRPDGWWRDRAGAATRLLGRLAALPGHRLPGPAGEPIDVGRVVAVVEGAAREARAPVDADQLDVVRAAGSGDDALVATVEAMAGAGDQVLAVTADRGLRARLPEGTAIAGPGWLLGVLDAAGA